MHSALFVSFYASNRLQQSNKFSGMFSFANIQFSIISLLFAILVLFRQPSVLSSMPVITRNAFASDYSVSALFAAPAL